MTSKTIIITGTHHTPAIELIKQLKADSKYIWKIHYLAHSYPTETHIKNTLLPILKNNFHPINSGKFDRKNPFKAITSIPQTLYAFISSLKLISRINPDIIVSFGGYVSVPVILAASFSRVPSISHEQTLTISLSTKINSLFASKIALSFPNKNHPKAVITGNLLRSEIYNNNVNFFKNKKLNIHKFPLIYITGGNQGSQFINQIISQILPKICQDFTVIHQTGINKLQSDYTHPNYIRQDYINLDEIGPILNNASLIISRSGANICQEIVALKKNNILIPHPFTQQNEQIKNAIWVKHKLPDRTKIMYQDQLTPSSLLASIKTNITKVKRDKVIPRDNYRLLYLIHELV